MFVVHSVNSFVGKTGNIGQRTGYILDKLEDNGDFGIAIARGAVDKYKRFSMTMGLLGHVPRLLNAYRIYVDVSFNMRKYDILLYDSFCRSILRKLIARLPGGEPRVLHSWELSPRLLEYAKKEGFYIIQDIPIAPVRHARKLHESGLMPFRNFDFGEEIEKEKTCFSFADHFVVPSDFVREVLAEYNIGSEKISVIPFGCDIRSDPRGMSNDEPSGIKFCFAGTINIRKGIDFLIKAFGSPEFRTDTLHLCGRLFPDQSKLIRNSGLTNIVLPGFVDTGSYFPECDVYVFPSLMEGSSKSIYEAMSAGLPVITTYNSGSIIRNGIDGFIIPPGDEAAIREKMRFFKENPQKIMEMGKNAFERVKEFPWSRYAGSVVDLYRKITRNSLDELRPDRI